jgi:hypothetical protein
VSEIEVTQEMIEAGEEAYDKSLQDYNLTSRDFLVAMYRAMKAKERSSSITLFGIPVNKIPPEILEQEITKLFKKAYPTSSDQQPPAQSDERD